MSVSSFVTARWADSPQLNIRARLGPLVKPKVYRKVTLRSAKEPLWSANSKENCSDLRKRSKIFYYAVPLRNKNMRSATDSNSCPDLKRTPRLKSKKS